MTPTKSKQRNTILWLAAEVILLSLSTLAFWGTRLAQAGDVEAMFPWQIDKLRRLLVVSGAWLAFVGLIVLVSHLLRHRTANPSPQSRSGLPVWVLSICIIGNVVAYGWLASERHARFNSTG